MCEPTPLFDDDVVLQDDKGWELLDVVSFRDFPFLVHVDFAKRHFREVLVESIIGGLELRARLAPRCVEVDARGFASLPTFRFGFVRRGVGLLRLPFLSFTARPWWQVPRPRDRWERRSGSKPRSIGFEVRLKGGRSGLFGTSISTVQAVVDLPLVAGLETMGTKIPRKDAMRPSRSLQRSRSFLLGGHVPFLCKRCSQSALFIPTPTCKAADWFPIGAEEYHLRPSPLVRPPPVRDHLGDSPPFPPSPHPPRISLFSPLPSSARFVPSPPLSVSLGAISVSKGGSSDYVSLSRPRKDLWSRT